jgi:formylglycine-generating enzyme required for sulfatase activity
LLPAARESLVLKVVQLYRDEADPGLHGAAEWLLRRWGRQEKIQAIDREWMKQKEQRIKSIRQELAKDQAKPQWYINSQGQTLVVLPGPMEFYMGSPATEAGRSINEVMHRRRIGRTYALAAKPVTVEQFLRFRKDFNYLAKYVSTLDCPVHAVTWYLAAEYCNWLSEQDGLPKQEWCYQPNPEGVYGEGMRLAPNFWGRTGYRLPTEAEWEYACRAGTVTARYYGESEDLLGHYAWYLGNAQDRSWPVGTLKPNEWGLFDMHGNVWNWCQDSYQNYHPGEGGKPIEDQDEGLSITDSKDRALRGGAFIGPARSVRAAVRLNLVPMYRSTNAGLRPARTFR